MKSCPGKENRGWRNAVCNALLIALALGGGPVACLSDVVLPECVKDHTCGAAGGGAGGDAGAADTLRTSSAGDAGSDSGGDVAVGGAGTAGTGGAGTGGTAGGGAGTGGAGTGGAGAGTGGTAGDSGGAGGGAARGGDGGGGGQEPTPCPGCLITPLALPPPCQSIPYDTTLTVSGGTPPYVWALSPASDPWSIVADSGNSANGKLSGQATSPSSLTVAVTDALGHAVSRTFDVKPRTGCWFAYTALEAAGPQLKLVDPILNTLPPLAHNEGVYDFQFSPNGQYLAYRYGADVSYPQGRHLSIVSLRTLTEKTLNLTEDAVTAFSWSNDSSVLAVAFKTGSPRYLGGVRLSPTGAPGFPATIETLAATAASVDSPLYWVGAGYLAYASTILFDQGWNQIANPSQKQTPYYTALGSLGFAAPVPPNSVAAYPSPTFLQPAEGGFFMIGTSTNFYSLPSGTAARHQSIDLVAPSGRFTAELDDGQLLLFDATAGNVTDEPTYSSADVDDCPKLLAWAKGTERIACVANVESDPPGTTHGEIRLFDLQPPSTLGMRPLAGFCEVGASSAPCGPAQYDYTEDNSELQARGFSPSGRWFAFTTPAPTPASGYVYWADLSAQPITLIRSFLVSSSNVTSTSPTALSYSADERYLLVQLGNLLTAYELLAPPPVDFGSGAEKLSTDLLTSTSQATSLCTENYRSAPGRWCGNADRVLPFSWAPDSRHTAHRVAGHLVVSDLTQLPLTTSYTLDATDCNGQCASQFAFQPQP